MLKSLRIRTRLLLMLLVPLVVFVLMRTESTVRTFLQLNERSSSFYHSFEAVRPLEEIDEAYAVALVDTPQKLRLGLVTPGEAMATLEAAPSEVERAWRDYEPRIDDADRAGAARLRARLDENRRLFAVTRELIAKGDQAALDRLAATELYPKADAVHAETRGLTSQNLDAGKRNIEGDRRRIPVVVLWTTSFFAFLVLAILFVGWSVIRSISGSLSRVTGELDALSAGEGRLSARIPVENDDEVGDLCRSFNKLMEKLQFLIKGVQESGIKVASSSTELAASAKQQEATIAQQVVSTNEVEGAARQIARTATDLSHTMDTVNATARQAIEAASTGQADLARMEATMRQMQNAATSISDKLSTINAKAASITGIVTTITKIADQTNLLSLNASIEAAKAGEFGQGFGVVAREIRRLADQTAVATLDIEQTIREMQTAVSSGVMSMEKFNDEVRVAVRDVSEVGTELGHIIDQVNVLGPRFIEVGAGMASQSEGARQISEAMTQLSESAGQTADALRESSRAIVQLNEAARELQREVTRFGTA